MPFEVAEDQANVVQIKVVGVGGGGGNAVNRHGRRQAFAALSLSQLIPIRPL